MKHQIALVSKKWYEAPHEIVRKNDRTLCKLCLLNTWYTFGWHSLLKAGEHLMKFQFLPVLEHLLLHLDAIAQNTFNLYDGSFVLVR